MGKCILIGLFLVFFSPQTFSQKTNQYNITERLQNIWLEPKDSSWVDRLNDLSEACILKQQKDSAIYFATLALTEAEKLNYTRGMAVALLRQSKIIKYFDDNFPKAETLAHTSLQWYERSPNKAGIDSLYNLLVDIHSAQSRFDKAIKYALKRAQYYQATGDLSKYWEAIEALGWVYLETGDLERVFYYQRLVYQFALETKDTIKLYTSLLAFGELYERIEDFSTSLNYYRQALQIDNQKTKALRIYYGWEIWIWTHFAEMFCQLNQFDSAWHYYQKLKPKETDRYFRIYLVSIGDYYRMKGHYELALKNLLEGLALHRQMNDRNEIMRALVKISKTHSNMHNDTAAIRYAQEGLLLALQTNAKQHIRDAYQVLYTAYDRLNNVDSAYWYYKRHITMNETVTSNQTKAKFAAFQFEQKIQLLNKEKEVQQAKLQRVALQKNIALISALILIIFGITLLRNIMLKRKNDKHLRVLAENELQIEKLESEKRQADLRHQAIEMELQALRAQMNPHFIFNCLNAINHFILKNETERASDYLTKFSRLVRLVLQTSSRKTVALAEELDMLQIYIELEQMRFKQHFIYTIDHDPMLDTEAILVPPLLLQPFVENAIWHGLMPSNKTGHLSITIELSDDVLNCTITDNGIGRHKAALLKSKTSTQNKSLGIQITANRLKMLSQQHKEAFFLQVTDLKDVAGQDCGTEVKIKVPVKTKQYATV